MIYFLATADRTHVKIGYTARDPDRRRDELDGAHPEPLILLAIMSGDRHTEKKLHARFAALRVRREWFRFEQPIVELIADERIACAPSSFFAWLMTKCGDDDPIGDVARDASSDARFPRNVRTFDGVRSYLHSRRACLEALEAAEEAWNAFVGAAQRA